MDIFSIISLCGGVAIFLFGMKIMGEGLEKFAGDKMQSIIESLTSNIFKAVLVGAAVTAIIQSSSATTVMVVGFVNAGIMSLGQSVGVIMGANIGTTVTAQILRFAGMDSDIWYIKMLTPKTLAPILLIIGIVLLMGSKGKKKTNIGEILMGIGILFEGMFLMEGAVSVLKDSAFFQQLFTACENPFVGILAGTIVTAIIQSSSASVGILQTVARTGALSYGAAIPIIMGQNIGTCITAILSSIGANKNAKKAACIHLYFNLIGSLVFLILFLIFKYIEGQISNFDVGNILITDGGIANVHTIFNIANTLILLPFGGFLVKLANWSIRGKSEKIGPAAELDERFLVTPQVAITQVSKSVVNMANLARDSYHHAISGLLEKEKNAVKEIDLNEEKIDEMETLHTNYLVKIAEKPLNENENKVVSSMFHVISDIERIGDHCKNLSALIIEMKSREVVFSDSAKADLYVIANAVGEIIDLTISCFESDSNELAFRIEPLEDVIDNLKDKLKNGHVNRLVAQKCDVQSGIIFIEIINNLERIADHCTNIALSVVQRQSTDEDFNSHDYAKELHREMTSAYEEILDEYQKKYALT